MEKENHSPDSLNKLEELSQESIDGIRDLAQPEIVDLESGDMHDADMVELIKAEEKLSREKKKRPHSFYRDLVFSITGVRLEEKYAKQDWESICDHKEWMSGKLGRNVGLRVAALDYYMNIKKKMNKTVMMAVDTLTEVLEQTVTDGLTGARNRRYFDGAIQRYMKRAQVTENGFCLLILDIDHFKAYNDINGHITGDLALIEVVRVLHAVTRRQDVVTRFGGEEFAVLLPDIGWRKALHIAESVRQSFKDYRFPNEHKLPRGNLTVSGGLAEYTKDIMGTEEMVRRADTALYQAKKEGRDRIVCFKDIV